MSLAEAIRSDGAPSRQQAGEQLRESWRVVCSMKRSTQQFRARLARTLSAVENEVGTDSQFGDVAVTMAAMVRILDWALRDLDRLRLPDELFEVVPVQPAVRIVSSRKAI
jgi:hypothetical protein